MLLKRSLTLTPVMSTKHDILRRVILGAGLTVALAFGGGCSKDSGSDGMKPMSDAEHQKMQGK